MRSRRPTRQISSGPTARPSPARHARFLQAHAGCWLPLFGAQVEKVSPGAAYLHLLGAAQTLIVADARDLGIALPRPAAYAATASMPGPPASPDRPYCQPPDDEED